MSDEEQQVLDLGPQKAAVRLGHRYTGETKGGYYYSLNGEDYHGDGQATREGAIAEAREEHEACGEDEEDFGVWTGRGVRRTVAALADGDSPKRSLIVDGILESAREQAYEWAGHHADDFLNDWVTALRAASLKAQLEELRYTLMVAIDQWADRYNHQPDFFGIEDTEQH